MKYILLILSLNLFNYSTVTACDEPHVFARVGAGYIGSFGSDDTWQNDDELGAQFDLGMRWPIDNWALDARVGHMSTWFYDDADDQGIDYLTVGVEYRWF